MRQDIKMKSFEKKVQGKIQIEKIPVVYPPKVKIRWNFPCEFEWFFFYVIGSSVSEN